MAVFFLSDLHIGHTNCAVKYRKFNSVKHQSDVIKANWVERVGKKDKVFILGDVGHNKDTEALEFYADLPGYKHLILGNHDQCSAQEYLKYFDKVDGLVKYQNLWLSHAPIHPAELRGKVNVHGHVHAGYIRYPNASSTTEGSIDPRYFNVNVDVISYTPIEYNEILKEIRTRMKRLTTFDGFGEASERYGKN